MPRRTMFALAALVALTSIGWSSAAYAELKAGDEAPDFTLPSGDGEDVSLSDFKEKKNVVLLFSRAHW